MKRGDSLSTINFPVQTYVWDRSLVRKLVRPCQSPSLVPRLLDPTLPLLFTGPPFFGPASSLASSLLVPLLLVSLYWTFTDPLLQVPLNDLPFYWFPHWSSLFWPLFYWPFHWTFTLVVPIPISHLDHPLLVPVNWSPVEWLHVSDALEMTWGTLHLNPSVTPHLRKVRWRDRWMNDHLLFYI